MASDTAKFAAFNDIIETQDQLRDLIGPAFQPSVDKVIDHIDDIFAAYIAKSTFVLMASGDGQGNLDISPKGDPQGFVKVLDSKHIAIPDRPGNRRLDTFTNLLQHPYLSVLFLVPGAGETVRVYGEARLVRDPDLLQSMAINGKAPKLATVVHVERAMIHCPKCVARSGLWPKDLARPDLPDIREAMEVQAQMNGTPEEQFEEAQKAGVLELY